jgi:hypothetical protein
LVVIFDRSPDGLAAGDELDPLPEPLVPDVLVPELVPEVVPPVLPDVLPLLLLPEPLVLDCAAAIAGAKAMTATTRTMTSFCILASSEKSIAGTTGGRRSAIFAPRPQVGVVRTYERRMCAPGKWPWKLAEFFFAALTPRPD